MKKYLSCFVFLFANFKTITAQSIENTINLYGINFPQEKIHIHFDKEVYLPGETIWFKAYLFEEDVPSIRSTNFYASLYDENGKLIQQQLCPIFNATSNGHFQIPDSLQSKQLICRAYTTWMLNFDTSFLFTKAIRLINNAAKTENTNPGKKTALQFYPEGGDIIEGTRNTIAFKSNYNNGLPFEINAVIKKQETGEVIMPIKAAHDGMGRFDMEVQAGEKFYAEWVDEKGIMQQTYLPKAKANGVSLKLIQLKSNIIFNIVNKLPADSLHVLMYMYQKVFYKTDIAVAADEPFTGTVPVNTLPTGVMQLTVFDARWQPVAERIAFINNNNYAAAAIITNKEISTAKRGKNIIEIEVADTIPSNMSLSITDAELNNEENNSGIINTVLLSGDVKGYIHHPAYYFTNNTDASLKADLDLVMLTHGWRRYNWDDMLAAKMPVINYPADNYLSVYGQVNKAILQKLDTAENVNLIVKTKDSTQQFYFVKPDATGLIKQTGLVFYDSAKVLYSFNKNKLLNTQMTFSKSNFTHTQPLLINNYNNYFFPDTAGYVKFNQTASLFKYYNANQQFNKDKTLQTVVVKSGGRNNWKNDPIFKMDEKYATGMFRGGTNTEAFDLLHDEMAEATSDIYNYIGYKSHLLEVKYINGGKQLVGPIMGENTKGIPLVYVDEHVADVSELDIIQVSNIAYVKVIYPYLGVRDDDGKIKTAISIYLKKGDDLIDRRPKDTDLKLVKIAGYSPLKEFYSPDYTQSNTGLGTDARTTLLWQPYIFTDAANRKVPITFYNNDFSKKLKIVLEGINDEGKIIHVEKLIE